MDREPFEGEQDLCKKEMQSKSKELDKDVSRTLPKKRKNRNIRGRRNVVPCKRRRMEISTSGIDGTKNMASKRQGSFKTERSIKRRREEEMGGKDDDGPCMSPITDMKQSEEPGTKSSETPIIVTGLESFTFHRIIGEGGFGKVLLATHPARQQQLAVKLVKKRLLLQDCTDSVLIERQVLEATGRSPFFTHAYATFQNQDYIFFVMEYLSGGDLRGFIECSAPFTTPVIRFFAAEIICGLQFLRTRGIIHRDIKAENILLDSAGHLKIADFGLSVMDMFGEKKISGYAGTLPYMAPEILLGKPYNASVDWFALGVMLFQMATATYPFNDGEGIEEIRNSLIEDDPAYPEGLNPELRDIIGGLLDKCPDSREVMVDNIRDQPFFMQINWTDIEEVKVPPPFLLALPPVMSPTKMDNVLSSAEAKKQPMAERDKNIFCGFTFANDGWQVIKPKEQPITQHLRTLGRRVRETFHKIWRKIKRWK